LIFNLPPDSATVLAIDSAQAQARAAAEDRVAISRAQKAEWRRRHGKG
jgi:hypothetical protein